MLDIKQYNGNLKGQKVLRSCIKWEECKESIFDLSPEEVVKVNALKRDKLEKLNIEMYVPEGYYLKVPNIKIKDQGNKKINVFYITISDDNIGHGEIRVLSDRPRRLIIPIEDYEVTFQGKEKLYRTYCIDVISLKETSIQRYYIYIELIYKNNGVVANDKFSFDVNVFFHKVKDLSITYSAIDITFFGYIVAYVIQCAIQYANTCNYNIKDLVEAISEDSLLITATISYFLVIVIRTRYIGNAWTNKFWFTIKTCWRQIFQKKCPKNYYRMKFIQKELQKQYNRQVASGLDDHEYRA